MTTGSDGPNERGRASTLGWVLLLVFFAAAIPAAISSSYAQSDDASASLARQRDNFERLVHEERAELPRKLSDASAKGLETIAGALKAKAAKLPTAAAIVVEAERELGEPADPAALRTLSTSGSAADRNLARIYGSPSPDAARLRALAAALPRDDFLGQLGRVQALEAAGDASAGRSFRPLVGGAEADRLGAAVYGVLFALGSALIVVYWSRLRDGRLKLAGHPREPDGPEATNRLALRAGLYAAAMIAIELVLGLTMGAGSSTRAADVGTSLALVAAALAIPFLPLGGERPGLRGFGLRVDFSGRSVVWAAGALVCLVPIISAATAVGTSLLHGVSPRAYHPIESLIVDRRDWQAIVLAYAIGCVQAPIFEELFFRGTLLPALSGLFRRSKYHVVWAIAISSLLFASLHPQGFSLWLALAAFGAVNSLLTYQTGSVLPGMLTHALYNATLLTAAIILG